MMWQVMFEVDDVTCVDWMLMWYICMSRKFSLIGHTNISIEDEFFILYYSKSKRFLIKQCCHHRRVLLLIMSLLQINF
jgi:hypothetical protein